MFDNDMLDIKFDGHFIVIQSKYTEKDTYYVFNHLDIQIFYHIPDTSGFGSSLESSGGGRIVSAKVTPRR
jgi:hypothetical protein